MSWEKLETLFVSMAQDIQSLRFESPNEAISGTSPQIQHYEPHYPKGKRVKDSEILMQPTDLYSPHPYLVAYNKTTDHGHNQHIYNQAKALIPQLEVAFQARILSPEFVMLWGKFCSGHGYLEALYFGDQSDLRAERGQQKAAEKNLRTPQKRWAAKMFIEIMKTGKTRQQAEMDLEKLIKSLLNVNGPLPMPYNKSWLEIMLDASGNLKATYTNQGQFSKKRMLELADSDDDNIPPILISFKDIQNLGS